MMQGGLAGSVVMQKIEQWTKLEAATTVGEDSDRWPNETFFRNLTFNLRWTLKSFSSETHYENERVSNFEPMRSTRRMHEQFLRNLQLNVNIAICRFKDCSKKLGYITFLL